MAASRPGALNWLYAAPALALMALVNAVPIGQTFWFSRRHAEVLADTKLWAVLGNTLSFTVASVLLELIIGLALALLLVQKFPGRGLVRAAVLIPWALPTAVMAMAWRWIYNAEYGILGDLLFRLGVLASPKVAWLASPGMAFAACVLADVWKTAPFMALLLMSGLSSIPDELYEAAAIDGAGPLRRFVTITVPLLAPAMAVATLFRAIQAFGIFDLIWVLTGGGPAGSTQTIALYVYDTVFRYQDLGYGCTLTLVMAACLAAMGGVLHILQKRISRA